MDTRIWMQESFWESAEEQNGKESPQENAEHLSKDQNENGGNKLVDQKTSLWQQTYENILVGMGFCGIRLNFLLLYYILPFIGILMIFAGLRKLKQEDKWFKAGYAAAVINVMITMISIVSGTFINREQIYDTYIWQVHALMGICVAADHSILLFPRHADRAEKAGEGSGQQNPDPFSYLVCSRYTAYEHE